MKGVKRGTDSVDYPCRVCKYCKKSKPWIWQGARLNDGARIYTNVGGSRWAGQRCPDCERLRVRRALKITQLEKDAAISELISNGLKPLGRSFPMQVKHGDSTLRVGLQFARAHEQGIIVEDDFLGEEADLYVLVFRTVRLIDSEHLRRLRVG